MRIVGGACGSRMRLHRRVDGLPPQERANERPEPASRVQQNVSMGNDTFRISTLSPTFPHIASVFADYGALVPSSRFPRGGSTSEVIMSANHPRKNQNALRFVLLAIAPVAAGLLASSEELRSQVSAGGPDLSVSNARRQRFSHNGTTKDEGAAGFFDSQGRGGNSGSSGAAEAPAGFDDLTNGMTPQGPSFGSLTEQTVVPLRSFNDNRFVFEAVETVADGLGPVYNAQSCRECHQNVVTGGASQIAEHRTGHVANGDFFNSLGGSLIQSRGTDPDLIEHVSVSDDIRTFRLSLNTLGDGFIEAIANSTLTAIRDAQPSSMRGTAVLVPVLEGDGSARIGRFGWKSQHASLVS